MEKGNELDGERESEQVNEIGIEIQSEISYVQWAPPWYRTMLNGSEN